MLPIAWLKWRSGDCKIRAVLTQVVLEEECDRISIEGRRVAIGAKITTVLISVCAKYAPF